MVPWYDLPVARMPYRSSGVSYAFGPGGMTPAVKAILYANIGVFLAVFVVRELTLYLGLTPARVIGSGWLWQPFTYMFVHADPLHILFNMLAVWMFGVELERAWGTREFSKYYLVTGLGAAAATMLVSVLPFGFARPAYYAVTIGASGAVYGLLLAYAMRYPDRPLMFFPIPIPVPAKYFVLILGAMALLMSLSAASSGVAHLAHLGGLVVGYVYLTRGRGGPMAELKYRWLKWRMARMRRRFDVVDGGRPSNDPRRFH